MGRDERPLVLRAATACRCRRRCTETQTETVTNDTFDDQLVYNFSVTIPPQYLRRNAVGHLTSLVSLHLSHVWTAVVSRGATHS